MNISVIGAGCGGQAVAGYAASQGHKVSLYNRSAERLEKISKTKRIQLEGVYSSEGSLNLVTTDLAKAIKDTDLIMVVTTANGHYDIAKNIAPYLTDGQTIFLNPGRTFGSLEFLNSLVKYGCNADVNIAEANTLIYATRSPEQGRSLIKGVKDSVAFSSLPYHRSGEVCDLVNELYPQFYLENSILTTSIGNIGTVFHPTISLLNKDRIKNKESFDFYREGATKEVVDYMIGFDKERIEIGKRLGVTIPSVSQWLVERYSLDPKQNLGDLLHNNPTYQGLASPTTLNNRYLTEDVPTGLVPLSEIGNALGVKTPYIDNLIDLASSELGIDFRSTGRTIKKLGLTSNSILEDFVRLNNISHIKDFASKVPVSNDVHVLVSEKAA